MYYLKLATRVYTQERYNLEQCRKTRIYTQERYSLEQCTKIRVYTLERYSLEQCSKTRVYTLKRYSLEQCRKTRVYTLERYSLEQCRKTKGIFISKRTPTNKVLQEFLCRYYILEHTSARASTQQPSMSAHKACNTAEEMDPFRCSHTERYVYTYSYSLQKEPNLVPKNTQHHLSLVIYYCI